MSIRLQKGQTINLDKEQHDLSMVTIGLGWNVREKSGGWLSRLLTKDYDLDAVAILLDSNGKLRNPGNKRILVGADIIFFNNLKHSSGAIYHTGDNLTGGSGSDDEQIVVNLNVLDRVYDKIVFWACIYKAKSRKQHFGMVKNAYIRAVDANGKEIARYDLSDDPKYENKGSMTFGEVYRSGGDWKFKALGDAFETSRIIDVSEGYLL